LTTAPITIECLPNDSFFTYSLSIDCFPVKVILIVRHQWLGDGTHLPTCANDGETSYSGLSTTWRPASPFPGSLPKCRCIPGPPYLFPSGTQPSTTSTACVCRKTSEPMLSPHSNTLTAYAKSVSHRDGLFILGIGRRQIFPGIGTSRLYGPPFITLPREFLCGPTPLPRLRTIFLRYLHLPGLPQLLSSSRGLVSLRLDSHNLIGTGSIAPEDLSTALSSTTKLEHLRITCVKHPLNLRSLNSSPDNLVVLPALTYFHFGDSIEYLENLVSWIHAPHLMNLIVDDYEDILDVPQLSQFISHTEQLSSLPLPDFHLPDHKVFKIEHHFTHPPSPQEVSCVYSWKGPGVGWQVSQVGHICAQLSPLASSVKQLKLSVSHLPMIQHKTHATTGL